jgi:hypothetical protein
MADCLHEIYRYRAILGRCASGAELDMADIQELGALETLLDQAEVSLPAMLRSGRFCDPVRIATVGPGGVVLAGCPWVDVGDVVEIAIEHDEVSYRFKGSVTWTGEDLQGDLDVAIAFVGIPVLLRRGPRAPSDSMPEPILAQNAA